MNVTKTNFRNKMEGKFLMDAMMIFIERDIAVTISADLIIDDFKILEKCQVPFS